MPKTKTKVIFTQDVPGTAHKHEVKEVLTGYFRNYLLPNGLAIIATKGALESLEEKRKIVEKEKESRVKESEQKAKEITKLNLEMAVKAGKDGEVFSSITKEDLEKALAEKGFEGASVNLKKPIRELGEKTLEASLGDGISSKLKVTIVPEK